jgi:hypothetical protein
MGRRPYEQPSLGTHHLPAGRAEREHPSVNGGTPERERWRDAEIVFHAMNGAEVLRKPVTGPGDGRVSTSGLAPGTYLYRLVTPQGPVGSQRLVVVR